jgi:hypothetical protein
MISFGQTKGLIKGFEKLEKQCHKLNLFLKNDQILIKT